MPKINAKYIHAALLAVVALFLNACGHYPAINVKVVDAETSEPIEGAVLLSQWAITSGLGYTSTHDYKVVETMSDEHGILKVEGVTKAGLNPPSVSVYKRGYVAWNSQRIFPDYKRRNNFYWKDNYIFQLERFKEEYSIPEHVLFIKYQDSSNTNGIYREAWRWETLEK